MTLSTLSTKQFTAADLPPYFRGPGSRYNTFIACGDVKRGVNEPYCYTEEKQCAGHICRVLRPEKTVDAATVIREDGTVWQIRLSNFKQVDRLEII